MKWLTDAWYTPNSWITFFSPLSAVFSAIVRRRRKAFLEERKGLARPPIPIIIIGNIAVGGTGKSPLVIHLVDWLRKEGFTPGIISRGYGGKAPHYPYEVTLDSLPAHSGDEPLMIHKQAGCPVVVDPNRASAAQHIYEACGVDLILADDGLQHYRLERDLEVVVMDGKRLFGNGLCFPAGPLREPVDRIDSVDMVVINGSQDVGGKLSHPSVSNMLLGPSEWFTPDEIFPVKEGIFPFEGTKVHAIAGIGNPERFFITLKEIGLEVISHPFADHHDFTEADVTFNDDYPVLMTEKDAVKCFPFWKNNCFALRVEPKLDDAFYTGFLSRIQLIKGHLSS